MQTINYEDLNFIDGDDVFNSGSYGKIRKCTLDGKEYAYKSFSDNDYLKGKKRKISLLSEITDSALYVPKFWVQKKENKNQYLSLFCNGKEIDAISNEPLSYKIKILKRTKETIISMQKYGIIHSDLIVSNIMIENDLPKIIDFDNCSYKGYKTNVIHSNDFTVDFIKQYGIRPEVDIFIFNILTFSIINDCEFYLSRSQIYENHFGLFKDNDSKKICKSFFLNDKIPNKDFLIDTLDETSFKI